MRKITLRWMLPILGVLFATWIASGQQNRRVDERAMVNAGKDGYADDWVMYGLNYQEQRYSLLNQIDATNVGRLGLAWSYEIGPGGGNQEATPLVFDGVLYSITNWSITYALDARTGRELWRYDPMVDRAFAPKICCGVVNRGLGLYQGKVFVPVIDGRLVALDASSGKLLWSVQTTPKDQDYSVTMAPRIAKNKVIIGNAGSEYPVRGYVTAYDVDTGRQAWRFYTVPGDPAKGFENKAMEDAAKTWSGEWYKYGGGGTVWDGMAYDPESNMVYFGTGNGGPWPSELRQSRGLDNLYVCSILAVDADTGEYRWHYQVVPEDSWDFDSVQQLTLADITINGSVRKVIMQANKDGFFYVLDRLTGKVISAEPFAQVNWASEIDLQTGRPQINPGAFYGRDQTVTIMPGPGGAHNWAPMSFNPTTNLMYIPISANSSSSYRLPEDFTYQPGRTNMGNAGFGGGGRGGRGGPGGPPATGGIAEPGAAAGAGFAVPTGPPAGANVAPALPIIGPQQTGAFLVAIDPSTQKEKWRVPGGGSIGGGTLTTAGNLVFQTTNNGHLLAYTADSGQQLLDIPTNQTGGMGPPMTFAIDGKQYIAVGGGRGANAGGRGGPAPATTAAPVLPRLYVYELDGKAENPTPAPPAAPGGGVFGAPPGAGGRGQ